MVPLEECPPLLRPFAFLDQGLDRCPPVLRQGFPVEERVWERFLVPSHFLSIPVSGELSQSNAIILLEIQLAKEIGCPIQCHRVYGLPNSKYQVVAETANNYDLDGIPSDCERKLRDILGVDSVCPKLWYLDHDWCNWDWNE